MKACDEVLAPVEERYALLGLHINFAKKKRMAQLNGQATRDDPQGMLEGKYHSAVDMMFLTIALFIGRSTGFQANCDQS